MSFVGDNFSLELLAATGMGASQCKLELHWLQPSQTEASWFFQLERDAPCFLGGGWGGEEERGK